MSPSAADLRPTILDTPDVQNIQGGTCPLLPMQCCIIWAARQEKAISPLAFKVYFAVHEVKFWRCKLEPGQPYHYTPYAFQLSDVGRFLPGVPAAKIARAFAELQALSILSFCDSVGIGFAERLDHVSFHERVKHRAQVMFEQLHPDTRDKRVKFPRRYLKLLVECGRRIVRAATLLGLVLTTVLTKRTEQYEGYKGCAKAKWIATLFGVNVSRVKHERAQWIGEGWFTREPTTTRARKKFGQWVRLNLTPVQPSTDPVEPSPDVPISEVSDIEVLAEESTIEVPVYEVDIVEDAHAEGLVFEGLLSEKPTIAEPLYQVSMDEIPDVEELVFEELASEISAYEEPDTEEPLSTVTTEVQPQNLDFDHEVQPLLNPYLSFQEIYNNQTLSSDEIKPGSYQSKDLNETTWTNIQLNDLKNDTLSEALREEVIKLGHLKPTHADRINFFAAIAHALRVAKSNVAGLLRTVVEKGLWHFISQADEYNAIQRLRRFTEAQETKVAHRIPSNPFLATNTRGVGHVDEQPIELSQDALIVQTLTVDLKNAGITGDVFRIVKRNGYLQDWNKERWLQAERELAQARLLQARQRYEEMKMTSLGEIIDEDICDESLINEPIASFR